MSRLSKHHMEVVLSAKAPKSEKKILYLVQAGVWRNQAILTEITLTLQIALQPQVRCQILVPDNYQNVSLLLIGPAEVSNEQQNFKIQSPKSKISHTHSYFFIASFVFLLASNLCKKNHWDKMSVQMAVQQTKITVSLYIKHGIVEWLT